MLARSSALSFSSTTNTLTCSDPAFPDAWSDDETAAVETWPNIDATAAVVGLRESKEVEAWVKRSWFSDSSSSEILLGFMTWPSVTVKSIQHYLVLTYVLFVQPHFLHLLLPTIAVWRVGGRRQIPILRQLTAYSWGISIDRLICIGLGSLDQYSGGSNFVRIVFAGRARAVAHGRSSMFRTSANYFDILIQIIALNHPLVSLWACCLLSRLNVVKNAFGDLNESKRCQTR